MMEKNKKIRLLVFLFFVIYCITMAFLLFGRNKQANPSYNLVPFFTIREFIDIIKNNSRNLRLFSIVNLFGNIIMFIPLGFCPPSFCKKADSIRAVILYSSVTIILIELIQYLSATGIADIDDYIFNMAGSLIGYSIYRKISTNCIK